MSDASRKLRTSSYLAACGVCVLGAALAGCGAGSTPSTSTPTTTNPTSPTAPTSPTSPTAPTNPTSPTTPSTGSEVNSCTATDTTSPAQTSPTSNYSAAGFSGKVMAGALPVVGASVQVYAAGSSGKGSAPTALLSTPLLTDAGGGFTAAVAFTCPYSDSVLYAVASGGHVPGGSANASIRLASVLGACASLAGAPSFTLNEETTVATVWAMAQFLAPGGAIGASASNSSGIALAAATAANLVNLNSGAAPGAGFPVTGTAPIARLNSLANLLNACVVSSSASSPECSGLYTATVNASGTPSNTLDAMMNLVRQPSINVATLFALSSASAAYAPTLSAAPSDWTMFVTYSGGGMNQPSSVAIDSTGKVWVANYFSAASLFSNTGTPLFSTGISAEGLEESYGSAIDVNDNAWIANEQSSGSVNGGLGTVTLLSQAGTASALYSAGGLDFPIAVAFDTSGVAWVVDYGDSHVTLLSGSGAPLSGSSGYSSSQLAFPVAVAVDSLCNGYVANQASNTVTQVIADGSSFTSYVVGQGPSGLAVDGSDNVWSANYYDSSVGMVSAQGTVVSGTGFTGGGITYPQGIAIDGTGNVWVTNFRGPSLSELAGASASSPGQPLSPSVGWGSDAGLLEAYGVAIDAGGNLWVSNAGSNQLTEFIGLAAPVKTPLLGPVRVP